MLVHLAKIRRTLIPKDSNRSTLLYTKHLLNKWTNVVFSQSHHRRSLDEIWSPQPHFSLLCLGVQECSKDCNSSSKGIDWLDWCVEDDNWGDYDRYTFHGVSDAKCQGGDLIQRHVRHLVVKMIEHTLSRHPPNELWSNLRDGCLPACCPHLWSLDSYCKRCEN